MSALLRGWLEVFLWDYVVRFVHQLYIIYIRLTSLVSKLLRALAICRAIPIFHDFHLWRELNANSCNHKTDKAVALRMYVADEKAMCLCSDSQLLLRTPDGCAECCPMTRCLGIHQKIRLRTPQLGGMERGTRLGVSGYAMCVLL